MAPTAKTSEPKASIVKIAGASFIGTAIEYYDFFLFGTAAAFIFNKIFFPNLDPLLATLASFATFGTAFIGRPLGGMIFGHFGDRIGRKRMLVVSLLIMGGSTVMIGLLPTYSQIGIIAPVLLVIARFLQGLAVGGEWSGAVLMAAEHAPANRRAFYSSWTQSGAPTGLVLATGSFWLVQQLPEEQIMSWGWRLPFLASAFLVGLGLWIRVKISETPAFKVIKDAGMEEKFPAGQVFKTSWRPLLRVIFAICGCNVLYYIVNVFIIKYGVDNLGLTRDVLLKAICLGSLIQIVTIPAASLLADMVGRKPVLLVGNLVLGLAAFPILSLVDQGRPEAVYMALILSISFVHAICFGPLAGFAAEQFATRLRYSGSAMGIQIGGLISSGPVPFVATGLVSWGGGSWPLGIYIIVAAAISFVAILTARETFRDGSTAEYENRTPQRSAVHAVT
ncbi:MHS family MFS transporter [Agrobacterium sp. MOPV5]|uniref:MFS transporter n=1 Tax=Agrobacterium leguminum TaxID=2792015 RepID=UPI0018C2C16A|nr:MFS transporter [Agrobacterium leguminum]MBG0511026.1 MHS family MFS transporter [Agrobacterium leguminum]